MKRILYFYPHKFSGFTDGIHLRIVTILEYFKSRGFAVDMVNFDNPEIKTVYVYEKGLVDNIYLTADNPFLTRSKPKKPGLKNLLVQKMQGLKRRLTKNPWKPSVLQPINLPNLMTDSLREKIAYLLTKNSYDAVLITYSYWADIADQFIKDFPLVKRVIDPTDFLTLQQYYSLGKIGNMFGDEIERMSRFHEIIHISYDELLLFSNFITQSKHHFIPQFFEKKQAPVVKQEIQYDILFIGSGNPYNQEGLTWFFDEIYPLLNKNLRLGIAGSVCNKISFESSNVDKLGFVDDSEALYKVSRCTICPLKRGSGMKIKVIESLSYGIPVVSTLKGIDGFPNKDMAAAVLIANSAKEFADRLNQLLSDEPYYDLQCEKARQLFDHSFSMEKNFLKLDEIFLKKPEHQVSAS